MYDKPVILISKTETTDSAGDKISTLSVRTVFADELSIGMSEFYQAQTSDFKPELKLKLADYLDYQNEKELIYNDIRYKVLRTYRINNEIEITCYGGVHNVSS